MFNNKNPIKQLEKRTNKMVSVVRYFNDLVNNLLEETADVIEEVEQQRTELRYVEEEAEETRAFAKKLAKLLN